MTYIIHGATGAQGAPVHAALLRAGKHVTAAVREPAAFDGAAVAVKFTSVDTLVKAYTGAEGVFVHLPVGSPHQQLAYAQTVVAAITTAQPARVVVSTSGYLMDGDTESASAVLIRGIEESGVSFAAVAPRLFLENLLLPTVVGPVRSEGKLRYPLRADYPVSWASHLDVADVVAALFDRPDVTGVVGVGALPGMVGPDLAAGFSAYLDTKVVYESQTPDEFGALIIPMFGEAGAAPVVGGYTWRLTQQDELVNEDTSAQTLLGMAPRSVEQWLRDLGV